jgi:Mor family transcriptional regulator
MFKVDDIVYYVYQNMRGKSVVVLRKIKAIKESRYGGGKIYYLASPKTGRLVTNFKAFEHELTLKD